jgi:hypothetical protein
VFLYSNRAEAYFGQKQYDQVLECASRSVAINPSSVPFAHGRLIAALALSGREKETREAVKRYLALPNGAKTITTLRALKAEFANGHTPILAMSKRYGDAQSSDIARSTRTDQRAVFRRRGEK